MADKWLAARQEERDHLLDSLDDLDAEFAAGDIDGDDYGTLRADYTTRAAMAIRVVDRRQAEAVRPDRSWARVALWTIAIVVFAGLAGMWVADYSGSRQSGDSITGDIRDSVRTRLFQAQEAAADQDFDTAIELYDAALDDEPSNAEALAYRGWLTRLDGDAETGRDFLEEAVAADPSYPDARVFAAATALLLDDPLAAHAHLVVLDTLASAPFIQQLVTQMELRDRIGAEAAVAASDRVVPILLTDDAPFAGSGLDVGLVVLAAEHLAATEQLDDGLALFEKLLEGAPDDPDVRVALGWFLGRASVGLDEGLATAEAYLSGVIDSGAGRADAFVYRAFIRIELDDIAGAGADIAAYDALGEVHHDLEALIGGLRETLA